MEEELLACVDEYGNITGEVVSRKDFYEGKCPNKRICGVVFWIFDKEGNLLLAERGTDKEQGAGKISPPSGHVQHERINGKEETPLQACFSETEEELGLSWSYENFPFTDSYYPVGVIPRPKGSAENCEMLVKHYALLLGDGVKEKIKNNEAKRVFFEPWSTAIKKFGIDDNTQGAYQFFGTNKMKILDELDIFCSKIMHLDILGPGATWDTIAVNDDEEFEEYKNGDKLRPEEREGYVTWLIRSLREDLEYDVDQNSMVLDTITTKKAVNYEDIKMLLGDCLKDINTKQEIELAEPRTQEHTIQEFSEITASQSEINNVVYTIRDISKIIRGVQVEGYEYEDWK